MGHFLNIAKKIQGFKKRSFSINNKYNYKTIIKLKYKKN